jgi:leader peptidase (prepilin peptidase) / N-methyltransferase
LTVYLIAVSALLGVVIGSFLNVVVWRVPRRESIVRPASHCPNCNTPIRRRDNIPVVSWLLLRARCRDCGERISARYPLVEASTGVAFAGVAAWVVFLEPFGPVDTWPHALGVASAALAFLYLAGISVALTLIDIDVQRLPNVIVLPAYAVGGILLVLSAVLTGTPDRLIWSGIGAVGLFAFYFLLTIVKPGGMGFGDVNLAGVLGLYLGYLGAGVLFVGAFAAFALGGVFSIALMAIGRAGRKTRIPFGPWMIAGAWVAFFVGGQLSSWYLTLFGLA